MSVGATIIEQLKRQKRTQSWLAKRAGIKRVTFALKIKKERFTAIELVIIAKILDLDLNIFKEVIEWTPPPESENWNDGWDDY
jgi:hypothetical protein